MRSRGRRVEVGILGDTRFFVVEEMETPGIGYADCCALGLRSLVIISHNYVSDTLVDLGMLS